MANVPTVLAALAHLSEEYRATAAELRRVAGAEGAATAWDEAARMLDQRLGEALLEPLTLDAARDESGYTRNHLRRMLREDTVPNSGTDANPRILRKHLPRKPGFGIDQHVPQPASSQGQAARAVIEGDN